MAGLLAIVLLRVLSRMHRTVSSDGLLSYYDMMGAYVANILTSSNVRYCTAAPRNVISHKVANRFHRLRHLRKELRQVVDESVETSNAFGVRRWRYCFHIIDILWVGFQFFVFDELSVSKFCRSLIFDLFSRIPYILV